MFISINIHGIFIQVQLQITPLTYDLKWNFAVKTLDIKNARNYTGGFLHSEKMPDIKLHLL